MTKDIEEQAVTEAVPETPAEVPTDELTQESPPAPDASPPKPKHTRKKKAEPVPTEDTPQEKAPADQTRRQSSGPILTIEAGGDIVTDESLAEIAWHEIHNAYRTRRILTGFLGGIEESDSGKTLAVVEYKGFRVIIPLKEMVVGFQTNLHGKAYSDYVLRQNKLLSNMLGCEIDFTIMGLDSKSRSIVASRADAMLRKRKLFYFDADDNGNYRVYEGRVVQVRVIAVAEKAIRIEAFGAECSIMARDLSWDWIGDARDRYNVGDQILARIQKVNRESLEKLSIQADIKSISENRQSNLGLCRIQSKYAGKVTDVHKGIVYIRLTNGVNAIAHSCYDRRTPGKKDDVSFVVTAIDENRGVALGIITRIIRQNL